MKKSKFVGKQKRMENSEKRISAAQNMRARDAGKAFRDIKEYWKNDEVNIRK